MDHLRDDPSPDRWERLATERPGPFVFRYRQSPEVLLAWTGFGRVRPDDPPVELPGMINLSLDGQGRLESFMAVPPDSDAKLEAHPDPDWSALFAAAGLEMSDFEASEPSSIPRTYCQRRRAWRGGYTEQERYELVVEACALAGLPVYFEIAYPWSERDWKPAGAAAANLVRGLVVLVIVVACAVLARRHLRSGRGDRRGAMRLALFVVVIVATKMLLTAGHTADLLKEFDMLSGEVGGALVFGLLTWLAYLAVEPFMRRYWPESLVSWNRLLAGRFKDPLVGTHLLVGCAGGTLLMGLLSIRRLVPGWLGMEANWPPHADPSALKSSWALLGNLLDGVWGDIAYTLSILLLLSLLRPMLRKKWIAIAAVVLVWAVAHSIDAFGSSYFPVYLGGALIFDWAFVLLLTRFGPVAAIPAAFMELAPFRLVLTLDFSTWLANNALMSLLALSALMVYAYRVSLGRFGAAAVRPEGG